MEAEPSSLLYVAIGASAGGLEATGNLIKGLSPDVGATYILAQHLSPTHASMLVDLLGKYAKIKVEAAADQLMPQAGTLYVTPPNKNVIIREGKMVLELPPKDAHPKPNVDLLFSSLATDKGGEAVGVILSGTGSDGARGVKDLKAANGVVIVQSPDTAEYEGMPQSAIRSESVDLVLPVEQIGAVIRSIAAGRDKNPESLHAEDPDKLNAVIVQILEKTGLDFSHYKRSAMERRILRRMSIVRSDTLEQYLQYLRENPKEAEIFAKSAFISVTDFFRDQEHFFKLNDVLKDIGLKRSGEEIRIWVAGCSSGEEAYSIAVLLEELFLNSKIPQRNYRIFATDIVSDLINKARLGVFNEAQLKYVDDDIKSKYFLRHDNEYTVIKRLREHVIFSTHNLIKDPPFSRIDLISCRNVLIYFDSQLQDRIFSIFHYSIRRDGYLFLGRSESAASVEGLFTETERQSKTYRKINHDRTKPMLGIIPIGQKLQDLQGRTSNPPRRTGDSLGYRVQNLITRNYAPATFLIDERNHVMYTEGPANDFLKITGGKVSTDLLQLVIQPLRVLLRALIFKARRDGCSEVASLNREIIRLDGDLVALNMKVQPFDDLDNGWLVLFIERLEKVPSPAGSDAKPADDGQVLVALEQELFTTRENLQTVIEELEITNEELQASNEEFQATNEELQLANEELQTANEEMRSSNEELLTTNDELQKKSEELEDLATDLANIQESGELLLLAVNKKLRITRFVSALDRLVPLDEVRLEDMLTAIPWRNEIPGLKASVLQVIENNEISVQTVEVGTSAYRLQISPFNAADKQVAGAVLCFTDLTDLHNAQQALQLEKERALVTLHAIGDAVIRTDADGNIEYLNPMAEKLTGWQGEKAVGKDLSHVLILLENETQALGNLARIAVTGDETINSQEAVLLKARYGEDIFVEYKVSPTRDAKRAITGAVIAFHDVTEKRNAMKQMMWQSSHDALTGLVNRHEMEVRLEQALVNAKRGNKRSVLLYLDLDQFKVINDTCGHLAGDELLRQITKQIAITLRSRDTLSRLGGDEFGVLLDGCDIYVAEKIARKVQDAVLNYRFVWNERLFKVGVCIGVVPITADTSNVTELLSQADAACYAAKDAGGNKIQVHTQGDKELQLQHMQMQVVSDIHDCLENNRFRLYFQPIKALQTNNVMHWEVLLRMFTHSGEFLLPDKFLPAAERYGLIRQIDCWGVENTFKAINTYKTEKQTQHDFPVVSINVSGATIGEPSFLIFVRDKFDEYAIEPSHVGFELTETAAVANMGTAKEFIDQVRSLGCKVSLDDFGSGMSSYNYLSNLKVDYLKIDGSLVHDIVDNPVNQEVVKSINKIAHLMETETIAEYVESDGIEGLIAQMGVDYGQGFSIGRPIPLEEFLSRV